MEAATSCARRAHKAWVSTGINGPTVVSVLGQTVGQIKRSTFTYTVGAMSCFIVVAVTAVLQTLLGQAPLIFLREAESDVGQVDMSLTAGSWTDHGFLNHTRIGDILESAEGGAAYAGHAPRFRLEAVAYDPNLCVTSALTSTVNTYARPGAYDLDADNAWMYTRVGADSAPASFAASDYCPGASCLERRCGKAQTARVYLTDTARETAMGLGREWPHGRIPEGSAVVHSALASSLNVAEGDVFFVRMSMHYTLRHAMRPADGAAADKEGWTDAVVFLSEFALPVRVHAVVSEWNGKLPIKETQAVLMEYGSIVRYAAPRVHPHIRAPWPLPGADTAAMTAAAAAPRPGGIAGGANPDGDLYQYAQSVSFNLQQAGRLEMYTDANYDNIQEGVIEFASKLVYLVGYSEVVTTAPILDRLRSRRFVTLYLGLVLDILLFTLTCLSCILIYSLLMINVQGRTFELAVRRMLGTTRITVVFLLLVQALSYALPGWVLGLIAAELLAREMMSSLAEVSGIPVTSGLTANAVLVATVLVATIPLVSSIGPISVALGRSLRDALDVTRPKTSAVKIEFTRAEDGRVSWSIVAIGTSLAVFGFCIYYLIPLSLLSFNLSLFFNIFFGILIGMLMGLVLLTMNLQTSFEKATVYLWLWWEKGFMRTLTLKNLVAHRMRNRKTMVMYSLSISFIVLITVAANLELQSSAFEVEQDLGVPISVSYLGDPAHAPNWNTVAKMERVLTNLKLDDLAGAGASTLNMTEVEAAEAGSGSVAALVQRTGWVTQPLRNVLRNRGLASAVESSNIGRAYDHDAVVHGVSPSVQDALFADYFRPDDLGDDTGLSATEQLYTTAGSQGAMVSSSFEVQIGAKRGSRFLLSFASTYTPQDADRLTPPDSATRALIDGDQAGAETVTGTSGVPNLGGAGGLFATPSGPTQHRDVIKAVGTIDSNAYFDFTQYPSGDSDVMVSIPTLLRLTRGATNSVRDLPLRTLLVQPKEDATEDELAAIKTALGFAIAGDEQWWVSTTTDELEDITVTQDIMNFMFSALSAVALFLCYFGLLASTVTNIHEQTKEVGVLRALGLRSNNIVRVFVYESFTIVFASSLMGVTIGTLVGWTFSLQRSLFTELPIVFFVPWGNIITICVVSIACALLAASAPGKRLTQQGITSLLRTTA